MSAQKELIMIVQSGDRVEVTGVVDSRGKYIICDGGEVHRIYTVESILECADGQTVRHVTRTDDLGPDDIIFCQATGDGWTKQHRALRQHVVSIIRPIRASKQGGRHAHQSV